MKVPQLTEKEKEIFQLALEGKQLLYNSSLDIKDEIENAATDIITPESIKNNTISKTLKQKIRRQVLNIITVYFLNDGFCYDKGNDFCEVKYIKTLDLDKFNMEVSKGIESVIGYRLRTLVAQKEGKKVCPTCGQTIK